MFRFARWGQNRISARYVGSSGAEKQQADGATTWSGDAASCAVVSGSTQCLSAGATLHSESEHTSAEGNKRQGQQPQADSVGHTGLSQAVTRAIRS